MAAPSASFPDGLHRHRLAARTGAVVAGPDTRAWLSRTVPGETIVGARFLPGAGGSALGWPLIELRDQRVALSELGLESADRLDGALDPDAPWSASRTRRFVSPAPACLTGRSRRRSCVSAIRPSGSSGSPTNSGSANASCAAASWRPSDMARRRSSGCCGCAASSRAPGQMRPRAGVTRAGRA